MRLYVRDVESIKHLHECGKVATLRAYVGSFETHLANVQVGSAMSTMDEEMSTEQLSCRETMREGKRLLRNGQGVLAAQSTIVVLQQHQCTCRF